MILKERAKKPIIINGKVYSSIADAALALGTSHSVISKHYNKAASTRMSVYEAEITVKKKLEIKIPK